MPEQQETGTREAIILNGGLIQTSLSTIGSLVKTHGFVTVFACACFAVLIYFGNGVIESFKEESKVRIDKLEKIASESNVAHATGTEVIRQNTNQLEKVEDSLKGNTRALNKLYGFLKEDPPEE